MTNERFDELFGGPPRAPESPLTQREMDLAASVQVVTEEIDAARWRATSHASTGMKNLCLAGGVALNCVANGRILREGPFERHLDPAGRGRRRRRARRGAVRLAPRCSDKPREPRRPATRMQRRPARARASATTRSSAFLDRAACHVPAARRRGRAAATRRRAARRRARSSAGSRGGWSSARARSARAASSATRARRRCSRR